MRRQRLEPSESLKTLIVCLCAYLRALLYPVIICLQTFRTTEILDSGHRSWVMVVDRFLASLIGSRIWASDGYRHR